MSRKRKYLAISSLSLILLIPSLASANRGMFTLGPQLQEVELEETGQNAIVAWNGDEEIIILSTDVRSSMPTSVPEVLPLPSNPTKIEEGSFDSFKKLTEIVNRKIWAINKGKGFMVLHRGRGVGAPGVRITFHKKIGAHDITVVKVNDLNYFIDWVKKFIHRRGFGYIEISPEFKKSVAGYLNRDIKFFVFDIIEATENRQSIKPLIYRFKSDFLYYPLGITATSEAGSSWSKVNMLLISKGIIDKAIVRNARLLPETGFDYFIRLSKKELKEVNPEIADLFSSGYVMNVRYHGPLDGLYKDLVAYKEHIDIPTFFERFAQAASASTVFRYVSGLCTAVLFGFTMIPIGIVSLILLLAFVIGTLTVIFFVAKAIKESLGTFGLESSSYSILSHIISTVVITFLLLLSAGWFAAFIIYLVTIIGVVVPILRYIY